MTLARKAYTLLNQTTRRLARGRAGYRRQPPADARAAGNEATATTGASGADLPAASNATPPAQRSTFEQASAAAGGLDRWHAQRRDRRLQMTERQAQTALLQAVPENSAALAIKAADRIMQHRFRFLGSGDFTPADPDRPRTETGYQPIDWFLDPVRQLRFPADVPSKSWNLFEMRPGNADIKYPWELARCQHFLALAQAHRLTGAPGYAHEILNQALDFIAANPVGLGINWTCTMDIALRAANWCFALNLIATGTIPDERSHDFEEIYRHLYETGLFILDNLENTYEVTSNHFLSNVVGMHVLAAEFDGLEFAGGWDAFARAALEEEILAQVLDDGADYESSLPYHRLVTELFLGAWQVAELQGRPLSERYRTRLESMVTFLAAFIRPDGTLPVLGDADDGRLVIATGYGLWNPADARHLLAPAAMILGRHEWLKNADDHAVWEALWWGFAPQDTAAAIRNGQATASCPVERLFPQAGLAVSRDDEGESYLMISNAVVGTKGFGNHKHNDLLAFEYGDRGTMLLIDPGSYVYTSDFDARNRFRATAQHNTLMIDGIEQNEFRPDYLFRMFAKATPRHLEFIATGDGIQYAGMHDGYRVQLDEGEEVIHRRQFSQSRAAGRLTIRDHLEGEGIHEVSWAMHFAPGLDISIEPSDRAVLISSNGHEWCLSWDDAGLEARIEASTMSPSYGLLADTHVLRLSRRISLEAGAYICVFDIARRDMN